MFEFPQRVILHTQSVGTSGTVLLFWLTKGKSPEELGSTDLGRTNIHCAVTEGERCFLTLMRRGYCTVLHGRKVLLIVKHTEEQLQLSPKSL